MLRSVPSASAPSAVRRTSNNSRLEQGFHSWKRGPIMGPLFLCPQPFNEQAEPHSGQESTPSWTDGLGHYFVSHQGSRVLFSIRQAVPRSVPFPLPEYAFDLFCSSVRGRFSWFWHDTSHRAYFSRSPWGSPLASHPRRSIQRPASEPYPEAAWNPPDEKCQHYRPSNASLRGKSRESSYSPEHE